MTAASEIFIPVSDYALATTLDSGQAFRWTPRAGVWEGVIGSHWVQLRQGPDCLQARAAVPVDGWSWLTHYLQTNVAFTAILDSFPQDAPMSASVAACRGLRPTRQSAVAARCAHRRIPTLHYPLPTIPAIIGE